MLNLPTGILALCIRASRKGERRSVPASSGKAPPPGERLFVDYAGETVPLLIYRVEREAQVSVALMGVSGRLYAEAILAYLLSAAALGPTTPSSQFRSPSPETPPT